MSVKNRIKVYVCDIPDISEIDMSEVGTFPEYRQQRILSAGSERAKAVNYAAGLMLRDILKVRCDADISFAGKGKPYLAAGRPFFSLSHDDLHVVLAVGDCETGADTEVLRKIKEPVRKRVFTEEEMAYCGDDIKKGVWLWTRLEASLKLSGDGIGGIDKRSFSLLEDREGLYIDTFEKDGSVISVACKDPFEAEVMNLAAE